MALVNISVDRTDVGGGWEDPARVSIGFNPPENPQRCKWCGDELERHNTSGPFQSTETADSDCPRFDPDGDSEEVEGPHSPEPIPLGWAGVLDVNMDAGHDVITIQLSTAHAAYPELTLSITRMPDDHPDHPGKIIFTHESPELSDKLTRLSDTAIVID